jgi:hypothetical protein
MESEHERLRQLVFEYWKAYYTEIRRELTNYVSDPESKRIPLFLRRHPRYIDVMEFEDGYVIVHRTVPPEEFDQVTHRETFNIYLYAGQTVGAATGHGYPPHGDFIDGETRTLRNEETGEYAPPTPPERIESKNYVSNNRVATMLTPDMAREEARKNLQEFFARSS